jgi:molecular chaperone DnaJ
MKTIRVNIPAGVRPGSRIKLTGKGEPGEKGAGPGDLYVLVHVHKHPVFHWRGADLEAEVPLTIPEALLGAEVEVPTLKGKKKLRIAAGTKSGTKQRLKGAGPPSQNGGGNADIYYRLVLDIPKDLNEEQHKAVEELARLLPEDPRRDLFK